MTYVYRVTHKVSGKTYIGISQNTNRRWKTHLHSARSGSLYPFHCALRKYGAEAFTWLVVANLPTQHEAKIAEMLLIALLRPEYNATRGGDGVMAGRRHSADSIERMRDAKLGVSNRKLKGTQQSDTHKQALRESLRRRAAEKGSTKKPRARLIKPKVVKEATTLGPKQQKVSPWRRMGWLR